MSDVFISYSRVDKDFVKRLTSSLTAAGRDVWVDWEDIPPSAEWRQEIYTAIREADAFLFVISPDSCLSPVCKEEIEQAVSNHKRIIPVLFRPAERDQMAKEIREHNWIYGRQSDNYEEALNLIGRALDTDLEWVKSHTRLQVRAAEWEQNRRSPSFTLRGEDLTNAEVLLESPQKEPHLTDLQVAYITSSRKIQARNQRRLLLGVSLALIVSLMLGSLAFWQFQVANGREQARATQQAIAESERDRAELQAGLATSGRLAAESQMDLAGSFPDTAVKLALEALDQYPYTPQAERALAEAVQKGRILASFPDALAAHLSPDGSRVAVAGTDQAVHIFDAVSREQLLSIPFTNSARLVRWSPDGSRLVVLEEDGTATIYNAANGKIQVKSSHSMQSTGHYPLIEWSPDGDRLAQISGTADGDYVSIWSAESGDDLATLNTATQHITNEEVTSLLQGWYDTIGGLAWSPDGERLITVHPLYGCCGLTIIWDANIGEALHPFATGPFKTVGWSSQGAIMAGGWDVTGVVTFNPENGDTQLFDGDVLHIDNLNWSPDGKYVAYATEAEDTLRVREAASGKELFTYKGNFREVYWSQVGTLLAYDSQAQAAWLIDPRPDKSIAQLPGGKAASWNQDGSQILVVGEPDIYNLQDVLASPDPQKAAEKVLPAWEYLPDGSETSLQWSMDGTITVSSQWGTTQQFVFNSPAKRNLPSLFADNLTFFSPDGSRAVVINDQIDTENLTGVYTAQGERLYPLPLNPIAGTWTAAWSPDGSRLATAAGSLIQVWEASTGKLLVNLRGHSGDVSSLSWSPDGKRLVSASGILNVGASDEFLGGDRTVRVWDVESGQELYQMMMPPGGLVSSALWSPDGKYLLTTDANQDVTKVWRIWQNLEDLVAYARGCCVARPLNEEERLAYGLH